MLERNLWQQLQRALKQDKWPYVRIEATAAGIPDVLVADSDGQLHLIELKMVIQNRVIIAEELQVKFVDISSHFLAINEIHCTNPVDLVSCKPLDSQ